MEEMDLFANANPATESYEAGYQAFVCESLPIPPGTKAPHVPDRARRFGLPGWPWLVVAAALAALAWLAGWLMGGI